MALRGVRSSWLMLARNWLLARLAISAASRALSNSRMSRRMPIAPITRPSVSRKAEAFSVVEMVSPLALRGLRRALRVTPFSTTSRRAAVNSRVSSGLIKRQRLLHHLIAAEAQQLRNGIVGLQDLALQVGDKHRIGRVLDEAFGIGPRLVQLTHVAEDADGGNNGARSISQG